MLSRSHFRKPSNYYLAFGSEVARPFLVAVARCVSVSPATEPQSWRRGLLLGAAHIGDLLYRSASLAPLKSGLPDCEWHFLAEPGPSEVLTTHPALAGIIKGAIPCFPSHGFLQLAQRLRQYRFDAAICYDAGNYWPSLLLVTLAGIPNRVGYTHKGFSGLVTHPVSMQSPQPYPAYFRDLVAELTGEPADWSIRPVVKTTDADEAEADSLWQELGLSTNEPVLACFVTTRQPSGQWPRDHYARTIKLLSERIGLRSVLCGAPGDAQLLNDLKSAHGLACPIVPGRLGLRSLVAFLRRCTAVFSTDSGPRHLANASGIPVFFMRNLWSPKIETGAYLDTEIDLAPEGERVAAGAEASVFNAVTPESVASRIANEIQLIIRRT